MDSYFDNALLMIVFYKVLPSLKQITVRGTGSTLFSFKVP